MSDNASAAYETLIQFLYQAPIGLVQARLDGEITMINPMSAQLLMPLVPGGNLLNLFDVLAPAAPALRALVGTETSPGAVICKDLHLPVPKAGLRNGAVVTLSVDLLRLDADTLMASITDITLARQQEQQRLATHLRDATRVDKLTSMPNRTVVVERIEAALRDAREDPDHQFAVLFLNADRFDRVNLTLGQAGGDELLLLMAGRLSGAVRQRDAIGQAAEPSHTVGRLGGDEFVVVLNKLRDVDAACGIAQRLVDTLCKPYAIGALPLHATVSMGVVVRAQAAADAHTVLQDASLAMREAKRAGGGRYHVFVPEMKERARRRGSLEDELRQALDDGQLFVVYQPIVNLVNGRVDGVEALVRWQHPARGTVSPIEFIEIAEETGLIGPLGAFVTNEACCQLVAWQGLLGARAPLFMSVNLSRAQLLDPDITAQMAAALATSGLAPGCLQLEITESLAAQDQQVQARLLELKALGLTLALDDFGTGYSSLACLHQLPIDVVKIDRSFVSQAETSTHHRVLIEATVRVARSLGMRTVAEGVETVGQVDVLAALACDKGQGYLWSRPLPAPEATQWLSHYKGHQSPHHPARSAPAPVPAERLLQCLEQSQIAIALFDPAERLAYANRSFLDVHWNGLEGTPTWEAIMRQAHRRGQGLLIETGDIDAWLAHVRQRYRQQPRRVFESDLTDGRWLRVTEETATDGWQLCVSSDVTTLKVNEAALQRARDTAVLASMTDPLTGLPNRRCVFDRLAALMAEASGLRIPLTVAAIDLDHFKRINDTHGHAEGDRVLVGFARRLAGTLRQRDGLGRIGGEEFLLVLMNTGSEGALRVLGEMRCALQSDPLLQQWPHQRIDFSSGIAQAHPGDTIESLWRRADQGLYAAKAAGRSRDWVVAPGQAGPASAWPHTRPGEALTASVPPS